MLLRRLVGVFKEKRRGDFGGSSKNKRGMVFFFKILEVVWSVFYAFVQSFGSVEWWRGGFGVFLGVGWGVFQKFSVVYV